MNIILPDSFQVIINDKHVKLNQTWYDSLKSEAEKNITHYQIAYHRSNKRIAEAKLRIPQTFSFNQVIRQVIMYYSLLNSDIEREKETVFIYPYFIDVDEAEYGRCYYSENTYYFNNNKWKTITSKSPPTPEEKFIHNQILKIAMQNTLVREEIPESAIREVSFNQDKSFDEIYRIYKKVTLWNTQKEF